MASSISTSANPSSSRAAGRIFLHDISCDRFRCNRVSFSRKPKLTTSLSSEKSDDDDDDDKKGRKIASWKKWAVGVSLSIILPSYRRKLGPLGILINRVNEVIETTETVTEVVEDVAEDVRRLAEELERRLPPKQRDGKLKEALDLVEKLAEETIKTTDLAQELIDKVEEAEEMLEDVIAMAEARKEKKEKAASSDKH